MAIETSLEWSAVEQRNGHGEVMQELEETNRRMAALNEISRAANLEVESRSMVQHALQAISSAMPDTALAVLTFDDITSAARIEAWNWSAEELLNPAGFSVGDTLDAEIFQRQPGQMSLGDWILITPQEAGFQEEVRCHLEQNGVESMLVAAIRSGDRILGVLVGFCAVDEYNSSEEQAFFGSLGSHLATAMRISRLSDQTRQEASATHALLRLESRLGSARGIASVCETAANAMRELLAESNCFIWLLDPERCQLYPAACSSDMSDEHRQIFHRPPVPYMQVPALRHLLEHRQTLRLPVAATSALESDRVWRELEIESLLLIPLIDGENLLGVLAMSPTGMRRLTEHDIESAQSGAQRISRALQGERVRSESEQQLMRISLLNRITRAVGRRMDLDSIFRVVLERLEEHLPVDLGAVCIFDEQRHTITVAATGNANSSKAAQIDLDEKKEFALEVTGMQACAEGHQTYLADAALMRAVLPRALAQAGMRSVVGTPLQVDNNVIGMLLVCRGPAHAFHQAELEFLRMLSEQVALAAHHARLHQDLQTAYQELKETQECIIQQERLRALGQMASGIAHDFNNALSPVVGYSDLLLSAPERYQDQETLLNYIGIINTAARDAAMIVNRLREFYRHRDRTEIFLPVDLNRVVDQAISLTQPRWKGLAQAGGNTIRVEKTLTSLPIIGGKEEELREVLTNLIFNAVDAMPEGGTICVNTRLAEKSECDRLGRSFVVLEVQDSGRGMPEEVRKRCLEPFFTTKGERGTGLGLSMVHGIITRHEGFVEIDSEPGKGTTIRIFLPAEMNTRTVAAAPNGNENPLAGRCLKVLVAEDEPQVRGLIMAFLRVDGHQVECANDGREALERFRPGCFDLIVTDRAMPEVNGDQLARIVKEHSPQQPILMLTGFGEFMNPDDTPAGIDYVLAKPVTLSSLRHAITLTLKQYERAEIAR